MIIRTLSPVKVRSRHCAASDQRPLYPQERTLELKLEMSALCQKQTSGLIFATERSARYY